MNEIDNTMALADTLSVKAYELGLEYAPKLALAIITLIIGLWIIKGISKLVTLSMKSSKVDPTLIPFMDSLVSWIFKVLLFISVASMVGIATTSFIAVLGAAGLAIGLALQGSLANFAGGVLIMIFKPYKVGDLIESQGHLGVVKEVQIFNTILIAPQSKQVIIPNGAVSNGSITNFTAEGKIRVDLTVGISYNADIDLAKSVLLDVLKANDKVMTEPAPFVGVTGMGDSSVDLAVRPHCHPTDYWPVFFEVNEAMKKALDKNNISIPFPQRDVHLIQSQITQS
ncbi:mechanosensitive ion channel [Colwellia sp. MSW7]|jgi:small conductance mechanosensitive channel|uniref:Small-conductance mechanosensitive channel n=1 Tax=Colwellia maritima TaxID=2912588 RepID=A0ABS9X4F1_9GAMM|nr:mechanosensitive ion channel domain-containing protein [Colwellia maritima]MCI2285112.1 mechanosensitive ion channel [Colwellia maritima]